MKFIILSGDNCIKCDMAKKLFDRKQVEYKVVDAFSDEGQDIANRYDIEQIPAFFTEDEQFLGFDPLKVVDLK